MLRAKPPSIAAGAPSHHRNGSIDRLPGLFTAQILLRWKHDAVLPPQLAKPSVSRAAGRTEVNKVAGVRGWSRMTFMQSLTAQELLIRQVLLFHQAATVVHSLRTRK